MSDETKPESLAAALALLQTRLPDIRKTQTAKVKTKTGDTYTYTYAGLATVAKDLMLLLGAVGLSFTARPTLQGGRFVLAYSLLHTGGDSMHGEYPLPSPLESTPQAIGSAITYARRYVLCSITGAVADVDDDGQAARSDQADRHHRRQPEDEPPASEWDPIEQETLLTGWLATIADVKDVAALNTASTQIYAERKAGKLSPTTYSKINRAGAARRAELDSPAMSGPTRARLFVLLGERGITDRQERRDWAAKTLRREVESMSSLTEVEAVKLIAHLEAKQQQQEVSA